MEDRILASTKKVLGVPEDYTAFDLDIMTHINAAFSVLTQLGVGPAVGFFIEDEAPVWTDFIDENVTLNMVKTYIYLKARILFDPPTTSYLIEALNKQIAEYEARISYEREGESWTIPVSSL